MATRRKKSYKGYLAVAGLIIGGAMFSDKIMPYVDKAKGTLGIK
jgi:hypothetical protein